jgi:glycosyltransferase involved in cell wall biosynthesis
MQQVDERFLCGEARGGQTFMRHNGTHLNVARRSRPFGNQLVPVLALSTLCENPHRRTGLSTLWPAFLQHARAAAPGVRWMVFAPPEVDRAAYAREGVEVVPLPGNDRPLRRLWADHLHVAVEAKRRGAAALLTTGFFPWRAPLPVIMHVFAVPAAGDRGVRAAYRRWTLRRGFRRAALVITNSQWARMQLGQVDAPVLVSPEAVDLARFHPEANHDESVKLHAAVPELPSRYLLWASNFYPYKRVELALAAFARLSVEERRTTPLVLAGGDWQGGRLRAEATARRLGVGNEVRFLGWIDDRWLAPLYRGASALLSSSERETFGRFLLEAMACGCPCVVSDLEVFREVAGDAAVYPNFNHAEQAAAAIRQVLSSSELGDRLKRAGPARARRFTFERMVNERIRAIDGVVCLRSVVTENQEPTRAARATRPASPEAGSNG